MSCGNAIYLFFVRSHIFISIATEKLVAFQVKLFDLTFYI